MGSDLEEVARPQTLRSDKQKEAKRTCPLVPQRVEPWSQLFHGKPAPGGEKILEGCWG